jgi:hypothetical protein
MPTLFVACANTLVTGTRLFNVRGEEAWQANWDVIAAIERWQSQARGDVVVWSDRGADDARRWATRALPHLDVLCQAKDARSVGVADVVIDDLQVETKGVSYRPAQSFMVAAEADVVEDSERSRADSIRNVDSNATPQALSEQSARDVLAEDKQGNPAQQG